ncbi:MAG: 2-oxoglutarate dehydrogenase complex dihydrolipoyllysine-residue succinyltransferase [Deferrisomatales bacterium]
MDVEIRVPQVGESVQEALLAEWFVRDGTAVAVDQALFLIETDKVTLEVPAEAAGTVKILVPAGRTVAVGDVVGTIRAGAGGEEAPKPRAPAAKAGEKEDQLKAPKEPTAQGKAAEKTPSASGTAPAPSVGRLLAERGVEPPGIAASGPGGRLTRGDVLLHVEEGGEEPGAAKPAAAPEAPRTEGPGDEPVAEPVVGGDGEPVTRKPMSPIRRRIAERLLEAKRSTAMLTTFNEVDMGRVMGLRAKHKEAFRGRHGVSLGPTSFFVRAAVEALREFPELNAWIEGDEVVYHGYYHVGVAIGAERGLVVPVIRHADRLGIVGVEQAVAEFVGRVKANRLELSDLEGGTFSITNGGVFGSLLSTPILNPPQSAILGLHKIEDRPVAVDGQVVVRPMMYVALSYDHRLVDGRQAVQFLVRVKELVEDPDRLLVGV